MWTEFLLAGQGGQGVVELGNYLAYDAILRGLNAASIPSYGPETRSGKVKCYTIIADVAIDYPVVENPDILVVMNDLSMDFEPDVKSNGLLILNSSLVRKEPARTDLRVVRVPAADLIVQLRAEADRSIFESLPDIRVLANSVIFGTIQVILRHPLDPEHLGLVFLKALGESKKRFVPVNVQAAAKGYGYMTQERLEAIKG